ncbi:MAG: TonB-dependent receptor [Flavobacteriaceae bacterium]
MKTIFQFFCCSLLGYSLLWAQEPTEVQDSLSSKISLEEVTVAGIRAKAKQPMSFSTVTDEDLAPRNLGQDLPILLNFLPAVVTTSDAGAGIGYTGIRVRGSDATRVNVTINGIPYNDAESQGTYWVNLPDFASSVESIQLQRGVGTSSNGPGAFGASLNLKTDALSPEAFAQWSSSLGSFNTLRNSLKFSTGLLNETVEFSGRLSYIRSDGYVDRASSDLKSYFLQGAYQKGETLIKALAFGGYERTYQSWNGVDAATLESDRTLNTAGAQYDANGNLTGYYDDQVDNYNQDHYQLHWNQKWNPYFNSAMTLNYTYGRGYYEEFFDLWATQNITFENDTDFSYLRLSPHPSSPAVNQTENVQRKWLDNKFYAASLRGQYQKGALNFDFGGLFSHYTGDHFGRLRWANEVVNINPNHEFYRSDARKQEAALYTKWNFNYRSDWFIYVDFQLRNVNYRTEGTLAGPETINVNEQYNFFNPKAGVTYVLNPKNSLYASVAKAQREPNRTDFENGTPRPEKLIDYELGWRTKSDKLQAQINGYFMDYTDQLVLTGATDNVGAPIRTNVGESFRLGLEMDVLWQWDSRLSSQGNVALSRNRNQDFYALQAGQLVALGDTHLSYSPEIIAAHTLNFQLDKEWQFQWLSKYVGEQYMGNIDSEISLLEAYFTNDLSIRYATENWSWCKRFEFSFLMNNMFDVAYVSNGYFYFYDDDFSDPNQVQYMEGAGYFPQAGTNFLAGVSLTF